jgi:3-isopropylmalate dehydrogenase
VLEAVGDKCGHVFNFIELLAGGAAIDASGEPLPESTLDAALQCDALLLGAVGGPKWDNVPGNLRPEQALLGLRKGLGVYANLRPATLLPQLKDACPLKDSVLKASNETGEATFDMLIVRELTGGIYFGDRGRGGGGASEYVWDTEKYARFEIERILRTGFDAAMKRRKKVTVVDKANILESSRFWREVTETVAKDFPEVTVNFLYVDNAAMQLVRAPGQFDVIVTSNMFGDILSDEASVISGSIGMLASASLGDKADTGVDAGGTSAGKYPRGMYEPIHGSAPDIAGLNIANPLASILSAAMMLRYSFGLEKEAVIVEQAVNKVLDAGYRCKDIVSRNSELAKNEKVVGTKEMLEAVLKEVESSAVQGTAM